MEDVGLVIRPVGDPALLGVLAVEDEGAERAGVDPVEAAQDRQRGEDPPSRGRGQRDGAARFRRGFRERADPGEARGEGGIFMQLRASCSTRQGASRVARSARHPSPVARARAERAGYMTGGERRRRGAGHRGRAVARAAPPAALRATTTGGLSRPRAEPPRSPARLRGPGGETVDECCSAGHSISHPGRRQGVWSDSGGRRADSREDLSRVRLAARRRPEAAVEVPTARDEARGPLHVDPIQPAGGGRRQESITIAPNRVRHDYSQKTARGAKQLAGSSLLRGGAGRRTAPAASSRRARSS